jgi:hypothetical protein
MLTVLTDAGFDKTNAHLARQFSSVMTNMVPCAQLRQFRSPFEHDGVLVVRDDFLPGGTKARFLGTLFEGVPSALPAEGGGFQWLITC